MSLVLDLRRRQPIRSEREGHYHLHKRINGKRADQAENKKLKSEDLPFDIVNPGVYRKGTGDLARTVAEPTVRSQCGQCLGVRVVPVTRDDNISVDLERFLESKKGCQERDRQGVRVPLLFGQVPVHLHEDGHGLTQPRARVCLLVHRLRFLRVLAYTRTEGENRVIREEEQGAL